MRLIQFVDDSRSPRVGEVDAGGAVVKALAGAQTIYALAQEALASAQSLASLIGARPREETFDYAALLANGRVLPPLQHPDPAHCLVTGTGLTHTGSAATRDAMHQQEAKPHVEEEALTDSMRIFRWGLEGGKPVDHHPGIQPEWFYKGNGHMVVGAGAPLSSPGFALDAGEEPELVGLYMVDAAGTPRRLGFAIGNEFSDHVTERQNYLYLAHSKLRQCAVGPELWTGTLPDDLRGSSRIRRQGKVIWQKAFLTGESNMCHSLDNLEYHHFKYAAHRRPGDVHLHFMGTATLSFADGIRVEPGDEFEIDLPAMGAPLRNTLQVIDDGFPLGGVQPL